MLNLVCSHVQEGLLSLNTKVGEAVANIEPKLN